MCRFYERKPCAADKGAIIFPRENPRSLRTRPLGALVRTAEGRGRVYLRLMMVSGTTTTTTTTTPPPPRVNHHERRAPRQSIQDRPRYGTVLFVIGRRSPRNGVQLLSNVRVRQVRGCSVRRCTRYTTNKHIDNRH